MDALASRVAALPSGPGLVAALKATALPDPDKDALATAVAAVINEAGAAAGKENGGAPSPPTLTTTTTTTTTTAGQQTMDLATADCVLPGLALTHPRSTFTAAFFAKDRLLVLDTAVKLPGSSTPVPRQLAIPAAAITSIAVIEDVPEDAGAVLLLVAASHGADGGPLVWGKAHLPTLAIRLPAGAAADVAWGKGESAPRLAGHTAVVLCQALGRLGVPPTAFDAPSPGVFRAAASTAGGGCAVGAAVGAHQGYVFPLSRGLAFVGRPPALVSTAGVWRAVLGRARGGGSASFDLILIPSKKKNSGAAAGAATAAPAAATKKTKPKAIEFSSLPKAELGVVQAWLGERGVGVVVAGDEGAAAAGEEEEDGDGDGAAGADAKDGGPAAAAAADEEEEEEEDSSEDDSDFEPGSPSSDGDRSDVTDDDDEGGSGSSGSDDDDDSGSASLGSEDGGEEEGEEKVERAAKRARE